MHESSRAKLDLVRVASESNPNPQSWRNPPAKCNGNAVQPARPKLGWICPHRGPLGCDAVGQLRPRALFGRLEALLLFWLHLRACKASYHAPETHACGQAEGANGMFDVSEATQKMYIHHVRFSLIGADTAQVMSRSRDAPTVRSRASRASMAVIWRLCRRSLACLAGNRHTAPSR